MICVWHVGSKSATTGMYWEIHQLLNAKQTIIQVEVRSLILFPWKTMFDCLRVAIWLITMFDVKVHGSSFNK